MNPNFQFTPSLGTQHVFDNLGSECGVANTSPGREAAFGQIIALLAADDFCWW